MRRLWYAVVPVMVLAGVLAGCTRVGSVDPGPGTTTPVVSASIPTGSAPVSSTPTPVVTPTPTWDTNQQGAIDAVQAYLAVWADVSEHLPDSDVNRISTVAGEPRVSDDLATWGLWKDNGWHLVGAPVFEVVSVVPSMVDSKGTRYYVDGCFIIEQSFVADAAGNPVPTDGRIERARGEYTVLRTTTGSFEVIDNVRKDGSC